MAELFKFEKLLPLTNEEITQIFRELFANVPQESYTLILNRLPTIGQYMVPKEEEE